MVESDGLENRCTLTGTVGSNPTLSAIGFWIDDFGFWIEKSVFGKVQERLNWQHWKCCEPQKGSVGSNPTLSASLILDFGFWILVRKD